MFKVQKNKRSYQIEVEDTLANLEAYNSPQSFQSYGKKVLYSMIYSSGTYF